MFFYDFDAGYRNTAIYGKQLRRNTDTARPTALRCGTPYVLQAMDAASELNTEHQRLKLVQQRPSTQHSLLTPSGLFRVHYDSEGRNAVDPDDDDGNGIPDYIDLAATVLDSIWVLEVEQLGYNPPLRTTAWAVATNTTCTLSI